MRDYSPYWGSRMRESLVVGATRVLALAAVALVGMAIIGLIQMAGEKGPPQPETAPATSQPSEPETPPVPASETRNGSALDDDDKLAMYNAHEMVNRQLRDPDSALFDDQRYAIETPTVLVHRENGVPVEVCGLVNAKNGFGGYTGDEAYVVNVKTGFVILPATDEIVRAACPR